jgi:hypothetical protein
MLLRVPHAFGTLSRSYQRVMIKYECTETVLANADGFITQITRERT